MKLSKNVFTYTSVAILIVLGKSIKIWYTFRISITWYGCNFFYMLLLCTVPYIRYCTCFGVFFFFK